MYLPLLGDNGGLQSLVNLQRVEGHFKYLGMHITKIGRRAWDLNKVSLFQQLKFDMEVWSSLPLNIAGRGALFKMIYLP